MVHSYNPEQDPDHEHEELENVIPIAGSYTHDTGKTPEPKWTRLTTEDSEEAGVQLEIRGGKYGNFNQKAVIRFQCDRNRSGNDDNAAEDKRRQAEDEVEKSHGDLTFNSYGPGQEDGKIIDILRLDWRTKYACEGYEDDSGSSGSEGWGFFTWFIVM